MAVANFVYNVFLRKTSSFALTVMVGAILFERVFDQAGDAIFENLNRGKLWKDIKHNYEENAEK